MIVKNPPAETPKDKKVECLYEEFGEGVHLIKHRWSGKFKLMVLSNIDADALFIYDFFITNRQSGDNKIDFPDFYEHYEHIKKLEPHELIVDLGGKK